MWKSNITCQPSLVVIFCPLLEIYGHYWCRLRKICILTGPQIYFASLVHVAEVNHLSVRTISSSPDLRFCLNNHPGDRWDSSVLFPFSSGEYVLYEKSISRHFPDGRVVLLLGYMTHNS